MPLAKDTSQNTQERVTTFTCQAVKHYAENPTILKASYFSMTPVPSLFNAGLGDCEAINNSKSDNALIDNDNDDSENSGGCKFVIYRNEAQSVFVCCWKQRKSTLSGA
jgi:hypothetical protein